MNSINIIEIENELTIKTTIKTIGYVYAISDQSNNRIKIGFSKNPKKRLKQLSTGAADKLYLLTYFNDDRKLEKSIHKQFKKVRYNGEWLFATKELIEYLNQMSNDKYIDWDVNGKLRSYLKIKL